MLCEAVSFPVLWLLIPDHQSEAPPAAHTPSGRWSVCPGFRVTDSRKQLVTRSLWSFPQDGGCSESLFNLVKQMITERLGERRSRTNMLKQLQACVLGLVVLLPTRCIDWCHRGISVWHQAMMLETKVCSWRPHSLRKIFTEMAFTG